MKSILLGSVGLVLSLGSISNTYAQGADDGLKLEEIIVTAEKREVDLQKTPISIQVYKGEDLKKQGKNRIDEIMNGVIGVTAQTDAGGSMIFNFRGLNTGLAAAPGTPNPGGVALVIDGITQDRSDTLRGGTLDLAQVEVARGTQNSNIGAGSFAGSVSLVSNAPVLGTYQAIGSVEVGSYNLKSMQGVLNMPVTDTQAMRVAFSSTKRDGYASSGAGESDLQNIRLRYLWKPSDTFDITLTANNQSLGGNSIATNGELYTGHYVPYDGNPIYSPTTGVTYQPSQIYVQTPATYTFAAGSVLGPGRTPLAANTTISYNQPCTQVGSAFTSAANSTAPFVAARGCPVNAIALRDNTPYFNRSNPWNDGFTKEQFRGEPYANTIINNLSADINWTTGIGKLTIAPGLQHTKEDNQGAGPANAPVHRKQDTWQIETRLASLPSSKVSWLAGLYYHYSTGFEGRMYGLLNPTTAPPTLGSTGTTQNSTTAIPTLLASCYIFYGSQCTNLQNVNFANWRKEASIYGNFTWPIVDAFRVTGGARYTKQSALTDNTNGGANAAFINGSLDYNTLGGFVFTGVPGTNCAANPNPNPCTVTYVYRPLDLYHLARVSQSWNGNFTAYNAGTGVTTTLKTRPGEFQYSAGLEYDLTPQAMVYGAYRTASQPATVAIQTFTIGKPLELKQLTLGLKSRWFDNRLQLNIEGWDSKITNRTAASVIGSNYTLTPGAGASFSCNTPTTTLRTAVLGATGTANDSCFSQPLTADNSADVISRGLDLELNFLPTSADRVDLTVEYLPVSKLTAIRGVSNITAADVLAAAAANPAGPQTAATAAQQQATAQAIANSFNAQNDAVNAAVRSNILQESPKWSIDASYSHAFTLPGGSRITPRANMVYKSAYWTRPSGPPGSNNDIVNSTIAIRNGLYWPIVQPTYRLWNAYLGWDSADGKWSVNGYVTNIRNTPVMLDGGPVVAPITGTVAAPGNVQVVGGNVTLGAPRVMGVSLSANF